MPETPLKRCIDHAPPPSPPAAALRNSKWALGSKGPRKQNIPHWLAKYKIFPPGLIQMLLLELLLLLLLLLLLYVFPT